jgi:hypothetical protein
MLAERWVSGHVVKNRLIYGNTFYSRALLLATLHVASDLVFCFFGPQSRWFTGTWQAALASRTWQEQSGGRNMARAASI